METAQTAGYALSAMLELERSDGQTVSELAAKLALNRTVAQRIVTTLHRRGVVMRDIDNRYWLGPRLITLATEIPDELATIGAPFLKDLAARTSETVMISRAVGDETVIIARENGGQSPLRVEYEVGFRQPLSRGATSLAILAHLDADQRPGSSPLVDAFELERVRTEGYARTEGQIRPDMVGLAAPIFDAAGTVVGAVGIVIPAARSERAAELVTPLLEQSRSIGAAFRAYTSDAEAVTE